MPEPREPSGLPEQRLILTSRHFDGGFVGPPGQCERREPMCRKARLCERLLTDECEVRERARLEGERMCVPPVHLAELLEELPELEPDASGKAHPLDVSLLYREAAATFFGSVDVATTISLKRGELSASIMPGEKHLGA